MYVVVLYDMYLQACCSDLGCWPLHHASQSRLADKYSRRAMAKAPPQDMTGIGLLFWKCFQTIQVRNAKYKTLVARNSPNLCPRAQYWGR